MNKKKLYELCWKYYEYYNSSKLASSRDYSKIKIMVEEIYKNIQQFPKLKDQLSKKDIDVFFNYNDEIGGFNYEHVYLNNNSLKPTKEDMNLFIDKHMFKNKEEYVFYFRVGAINDFIKNKKIGYAFIRTSDDIPKKINSYAFRNIKYPQYSEGYGHSNRSEKFTVMEIKIKSIGAERAREKAILKFNQSYNVYKIMSYVDTYDINDKNIPPYVGYKKNSDHVMDGDVQEPFRGLIIREPFYDYITKINTIMNKSTRTDLENRILSTIDTYGIIEEYMPKYVKFLLVMISLETLLLSKSDKHNVTEKLAEKIVFLIINSKVHGKKKELSTKKIIENRLNMYKEIKCLYNFRSELVHGNTKSDDEIDDEIDEKYFFSKIILMDSIIEMIAKSKTYEHMMKKDKSDKKSLELYFQKLKFST